MAKRQSVFVRTYKRDKAGKFATHAGAVAGKKVVKKARSTYTSTVLHPGQTTLSGETRTRRRKRGFYTKLQEELLRQRRRKRK